MRLYKQLFLLLWNYFVRRMSRGAVVKILCQNMGVTYIKFGQILAMQNYGNYFTEADRQDLMSICNDCNPIPFEEVYAVLKEEYGDKLDYLFPWIDESPVGSASVSQVHRARTRDGNEVVLKVKRRDVEKTIQSDIRQLRRFVKVFGRFAMLRNAIGSQHAFVYYEEWLTEELDFRHEMYNIERYREFARTVNGKVDGASIVLPKLYHDLCTDNVIVMEYIPYTLLNRTNDREQILHSINTYVKLSFYAFFHKMLVVFHGDPHAGNIYITPEGNVGFLGMGLLFEMSEHDMELCRKLFFAAYFQQHDKLMRLLRPWLHGSEKEIEKFSEAVRTYCYDIPNKPLTGYFMDLLYVCIGVSIDPPRFLFTMAKALACLNGMDNVYFNDTTGRQLLKSQVMTYFVENGINCSDELITSLRQVASGVLHKDIPSISDGMLRSIHVVKSFTEYLPME